MLSYPVMDQFRGFKGQLARWRGHRFRTFLRLAAFLMSVLLSLGLSLGVRAFLDAPPIEIEWVLVGALPGFLALLAAMLISSRFVAVVYGFDNWRRALGYFCLWVFGNLFGIIRYPPLIVREGAVSEEDRSKPLYKIGGPGILVVYNDSAVLLERFGRFSRVVGPGLTFLERFERVLEIVDLRPQVRMADMRAYTEDGIEIKGKIGVRFQIHSGGQEATAKVPYPFDSQAVVQAALARAVLDPDVDFPWPQRVMGNTDASLRDIVSRRKLDELIEPLDLTRDPRQEILSELKTRIADSAKGFGVEVLDVWCSSVEPVDIAVVRQRVASWQASWSRKALLEHARGEADVIRYMETAKAFAQLQLIQAIVRGFQDLPDSDSTVRSQMIVLRFVEALRQMSPGQKAGGSLPLWALRTLDRLQQMTS